MKAKLASLVFLTTAFCVASATAQTAQTVPLAGMWSGSWIPKGGVREPVTVEFKQDTTGALTGKFFTPAPTDFVKAVHNPRTNTVTLEASDAKSGKKLKLDGKLQGSEMQGTLAADTTTGELLLVKWTYVPR